MELYSIHKLKKYNLTVLKEVSDILYECGKRFKIL